MIDIMYIYMYIDIYISINSLAMKKTSNNKIQHIHNVKCVYVYEIAIYLYKMLLYNDTNINLVAHKYKQIILNKLGLIVMLSLILRSSGFIGFLLISINIIK